MNQIPSDRNKTVSTPKFTAVISLTLLSLMASSCTVITGIFKAGMGFGIFLVLAVLVAIVFIIMRLNKK